MGLRHVTLGDIFRRNAQLFPGRTAIVCGFERISHSDFLKRAERLAAGLAAQGVKPGERVIVQGLQKVRTGLIVDPKPFQAR